MEIAVSFEVNEKGNLLYTVKIPDEVFNQMLSKEDKVSFRCTELISKRCLEFTAMVCEGAMEKILQESGRIWAQKHQVK
jgi:hypothetical protein